MTVQSSKNNFVITKRIAKHGNQAVIVIPSILKEKISAGMLVKITLDIIDEDSEEKFDVVIGRKK